jgi:hypothetical protein
MKLLKIKLEQLEIVENNLAELKKKLDEQVEKYK